MSKELKFRKHRLSAKKTLFHVLIVTLLMMFGYLLSAQLIIPLLLITPIRLFISPMSVELVAYIISSISGLALLFFYSWWFSPEYKRKPCKTILALRSVAPIIIYWIVFHGVIRKAVMGEYASMIYPVTLKALVSVLVAGITEELAFREVGISYMKRQLRDDKMNLPIILTPSVAFGMIHLYNAVLYRQFTVYAFQAICAFLLGIFFGSVFLRTGNIWMCMTVHSLHDLLVALLPVPTTMYDHTAYVYICMITGEALLALWGLFLIRKKKHPEIRELWKERWRDKVYDTSSFC